MSLRPLTSLLCILVVVSGCETEGERELPQVYSGDRIVSAERVVTQEPNVIQALVRAGGAEIAGRYRVALYKIIYNTVDAKGAPTTASGALLIPLDQTEPLPLLSYQHGTIVARDDAPSIGGPEQLVGMGWATMGYVTALPDYLGLGEGPGRHPFIHAGSEATAVVDLLRAARELLDVGGVDLTDELFLCGYSQGGHATMATLREIETNLADEFTVVAAAPMAGPYDVSGTMLETMLDEDRDQPGPYYVPYILLSYNSVYGLFPTDAEMFAEPYAETVLPLFDGEHDADEINERMPAVPVQVVADVLVDGVKNDPNDPLLLALQDNNVRGDHPDYDWSHVAPIRLYHCSGDRSVPFTNSEVARSILQQKGAQVELIEPEEAKGGDHGACVIPSVMGALEWFESVRAGR